MSYEKIVDRIPESVLSDAARDLSLASDQSVSLADFRAAMEVLFSGLINSGWELKPPLVDRAPVVGNTISLSDIVEARRRRYHEKNHR